MCVSLVVDNYVIYCLKVIVILLVRYVFIKKVGFFRFFVLVCLKVEKVDDKKFIYVIYYLFDF